MRGLLAGLTLWILATGVFANTAQQEAGFIQGANFNRAGNHAEAYVRLKALEDAGYRNRELDFEIGWSLMGLGRAGACVPRLERYEQAAPGRALTSEFLGRCLLLLRDFGKAEAKLREAVARDPGAKQRVDVYLAQLQFTRGDRQAAAETAAGILRSESTVGRALRDGQAALAAAAPAPGTGLRFTASASVGYNSNVIALGNTTPLPTDITGKSSAFVRTGFGVSNTVQINEQTRGSLGYGLLIDRYQEIRAANLDDHYLYADVAHRLNPRFALTLRASMQLTYLDNSHFRTLPGVRAAAVYQFSPNTATEAAYSFAAADYAKAATAPAFDRNGEIHAFSVNHLMRVPNSPWSGSVGYAHVENRTEGSDFRSAGDSFSGTLRYAFGRNTELALGANLGRDRYRNPNTLSASGAARRDNPHSAFVQISGPLSDILRYYVQLQGSRSDSNISFYDYKQRVLVGGISVDF